MVDPHIVIKNSEVIQYTNAQMNITHESVLDQTKGKRNIELPILRDFESGEVGELACV